MLLGANGEGEGGESVGLWLSIEHTVFERGGNGAGSVNKKEVLLGGGGGGGQVRWGGGEWLYRVVW
jgi:hypothetical protein